MSAFPRAGQVWAHPELGYGFTPGAATLERRAAVDGDPVWDYEGDDGNAGCIPEDDLLARGEPVV